MVDGDVFRMSEAAHTAESVAARVARKQTNKGRAAAEELAKSTATLLPLLSDVLPMLRLLIKNRWLLLRWRLPSQADKGRAAFDDYKEAAVFANRRGD